MIYRGEQLNSGDLVSRFGRPKILNDPRCEVGLVTGIIAGLAGLAVTSFNLYNLATAPDPQKSGPLNQKAFTRQKDAGTTLEYKNAQADVAFIEREIARLKLVPAKRPNRAGKIPESKVEAKDTEKLSELKDSLKLAQEKADAFKAFLTTSSDSDFTSSQTFPPSGGSSGGSAGGAPVVAVAPRPGIKMSPQQIIALALVLAVGGVAVVAARKKN